MMYDIRCCIGIFSMLSVASDTPLISEVVIAADSYHEPMSIWSHTLCKPVMNFMHQKCRTIDVPYLRSNVFRIAVPDSKVKWSSPWDDYSPPDYTDPSIIGKPWSDPISTQGIRFNQAQDGINRTSHICDYTYDKELRPLNPIGRTGLRGRGVLGRWGPNHAADPLVTSVRNGKMHFVAIQRRDTGEWALPGGMVDPGELVSTTLKREFSEEVLNGVSKQELDALWTKGRQLYSGYVDDPRNTDNSWMETVVCWFHDDEDVLKNVKLEAGDDAAAVRWIAVDTKEPLYASHSSFINLLKSRIAE